MFYNQQITKTVKSISGALFLSSGISGAAAVLEKPNVIIIYTDDHGWADIGIQSSQTDVKTPFADQLAKDGVLFQQGYTTAPQCVPSRAGIITGRYQTRFDMETNHDGPLPLSEKTVADRMKAAGYVTGMVGKWHLEPTRESRKDRDGVQPAGAYNPRNRGFDEYWYGAMRSYEANIDLAGKLLSDAPKKIEDPRYRIDVQTDAAISFMSRRVSDKKPFFLYLAYFAPHVPLERPEKYMARFQDVPDETRRMGLASIAAVDDGLGRIRQFLAEKRLTEKTVIFYIGDNGAPMRPGAWNGSINTPNVGEKGMLTDGGIRTPFIMAWPGTVPAGTVYTNPVIAMDATATAVALSGQPVPAEMDGVNLIPFLTGERTGVPHETLYWRWRSQAAILEDGWKLWFVAPDSWMLFNNVGTAPETENVLDQHPEIAARLRKKLEAFAGQQNPPGLPNTLVAADKYFQDTYYGATPAPAQKKPAEKSGDPTTPTAAAGTQGDSVDGWIARSGLIKKMPEGIRVFADASGKPPFITAQKLAVPVPAAIEIELTAEAGGEGMVSWRVQRDRDFITGNKSDFSFNPGKQTLTVALPEKRSQITHLRLIMPYKDQQIVIHSIRLTGAKTTVNEWRFDQ